MDNRAETLSLNEQEICGEDKNNKLHELKEAKAAFVFPYLSLQKDIKDWMNYRKQSPKNVPRL